jgi:N6-adenosine-specific RNA methylase IME4
MIDFGSVGKQYGIIYADPPWRYSDKRLGRGGCNYQTQSPPAIAAIGPWVHEITAADCVLFLWATWPQLPVALDTISAWGFVYRTLAFLWVKNNKKSTDSVFWGCGQWSRSNSEPCLLAVKGAPKRLSAGVHQIVTAAEPELILHPTTRNHSEKPAIIRDRIIELCGDLPKIELYSRHKIEKWDYHGDEFLTNPDQGL